MGSSFVASLSCGRSKKVKRGTSIRGATKWTENMLENALVKEKRRVCFYTVCGLFTSFECVRLCVSVFAANCKAVAQTQCTQLQTIGVNR